MIHVDIGPRNRYIDDMEEKTLHEVLAGLGWRSEARPEPFRGRLVFDATGALVGPFSAGACWEMLRERGFLDEVAS